MTLTNFRIILRLAGSHVQGPGARQRGRRVARRVGAHTLSDGETDGFIPDMIRRCGLKDDGSVISDFDLIEMDEGRWYPEMWRDAWK